jgi:alanine-glyoxylate transaminase/serine-glyoxylate transaminase/serine-pyruvate transaminase
MLRDPVNPLLPRIPGVRLLHAPGPTPIPTAVLAAMHEQSLDLADPRVDAVIADCEAGLRSLVGADVDAGIYLFICNGHGAWETTLVNLIAPGRQVLIPGTGHFSDGWAEVAQANGIDTIRTAWTPGLPIDADSVAAALREDRERRIDAVCVIHTDTASSVTSDLRAIRQAMDETGHPALLVVDVVASLAAAPFSMRDCGVDVAMGASQKGLMMPAGLGFAVAAKKAREVCARNERPRHYWDWRRRDGALNYQKFCGTPPLQLLLGLRAALGLLEAEGLEQVHRRHARLARAVHAAVERWRIGGALDFYCQAPAARSASVTTIATGPGVDALALRQIARERFQVGLAGGLGPMTGRAFRIGHLGDQNEATILGCLTGVEATLAALEVPRGEGAIAAAIATLQD